MITTGHLLIGGAIGVAASALVPSSSPRPFLWTVPLALGLGILSHHLLDLIPHTDAATFYPDPRRVPWFAVLGVTLEVLVGILLTAFLFARQHTTWAFAAGAIGGMVPDLLDEMPLWQERFRRNTLGAVWHRWHTRLHCADMAKSWPIGLAVDALVIGGGLWFLLIVG
jgi:hypothetical protein